MGSPYSDRDLQSPLNQDNLEYLRFLELRVKNHELFDHLFLNHLATGKYKPESVLFILVQIGNMVMPFAGILATLVGQAPDIESRFVLFDSMYEKIGRGDIKQTTQCCTRKC